MRACVPAEVRLIDHAEHRAVSEWMHAVVLDVSEGGLRIALVGHAAAVFSESKPGLHGVEVRLLPAHLLAGEPLLCELRWTRPSAEQDSWHVGVQFSSRDEESASLLVKRIRARSDAPLRRRAGWLGAAGVILILAAWAWSASARRTALAADVAQCAKDLQDVSTRLDRIAGEMQDLEEKRDKTAAQLTQCQTLASRAAASHAAEAKASSRGRKVKVWLDRYARKDGETLDAGDFEFASGFFSGALQPFGVDPDAQLLLRVQGDGDERVDCEPSPVAVHRAATRGFRCPLPAGDGDIVLHISRAQAQ